MKQLSSDEVAQVARACVEHHQGPMEFWRAAGQDPDAILKAIKDNMAWDRGAGIDVIVLAAMSQGWVMRAVADESIRQMSQVTAEHLHDAADDERMRAGPEAIGFEDDAITKFMDETRMRMEADPNVVFCGSHFDKETLVYGIALGLLAAKRQLEGAS